MYDNRSESFVPVSGWPIQRIDDVIDLVKVIASDRRVKRFYIGRGVDLNDRRSKHDADHILATYETDSREHAMQIEEMLIPRFYEHPKNVNTALDARGGSSDEWVNYVYVAIWWT